MNPFLSHLHTDLRRALATRHGATHRVEDVTRGEHKKYPRMEQIPLPQPKELNCSIDSALAKRHSSLACPNDASLSLQDLGTLLGHGLQRRKDGRRNYPSGGGLYPIETYLVAEKIEGAKPGVFHYNPTAHALERLWDLPAEMELHDLISGGPATLQFSALLIFTAVWERSSAKYGDFAYMLALLEAGHMSENILLVSTAMGLQTRPMLGFKDQEIITLLDIDEEREQPVHTITLCKPAGKMPTPDDVHSE